MTSRKKRKKRVEWFGQHLPLFNTCLWLVLCLVGGLLPSVNGEVPGSVTTTTYPSGEKCGTNQRCLSQASCSNLGVCRCPAVTYGAGNFQCYPTNSVRTELAGTPAVLRSFSNTSATFYWPGRFRLTEFTTFRKGKEQQCHFQIFGANQIFGGQVVTSGFEVHMQLTKSSQHISGIGIRLDGRAQNNVFTYTERGKNEFIIESPVTDENIDSSESLHEGSGSGNGDGEDDDNSDDSEWGPPEELYIGGGEKVDCKVDSDNFATIKVPSCSTSIRFRAHSVDGTQQDQLSGLSVNINDDNGPITFNSPGTYLAETKETDILRQSASRKNVKLEQEILHRVMQNAAKQYSTPEGLECDDTARIYRSYCQQESEKIKAIDSCYVFLENTKLMSCMDPSRGSASSNSLNAFKLCLWHSCRPSKNVCSLLKARVQQNGCMSLTPASFSARDCST